MLRWRHPGWSIAAALLLAAALAGCASKARLPAPVEDRGAGMRARPAPAVVTEAAKVPAAENAGKAGYHTVRQGETLIRIALDAGQNWRDIARWNNLDNPNLIEVGQVLRVVPPEPPREVAVAKPVAPATVVPTPVAPAASAPASAAAPAAAASAAARPASAPQVASVPPLTPTPAPPGEEDIGWVWPTTSVAGVIAGFDEQRNKGLDIAGKAGDPVLASADGRVVYAGAGLRGYGNLIILKHNNTYLSAYAHNQLLLVKEDQTVRKGQKIAEMGSSDADRVKLHFEIRRQGKPVDPTRYLPPR
ncbi:peptidoglycan DD-metalloendopeptidase family protein [Ramlibacter sp.]|uniref:peptidoglycan DD-metalloendopeptidase family protein n=1 Tax=Ramlibacter sp. TaxID=1917967 RepID=UPI002B79D140|nr:peptidoglycan DD-metalloendopeptidase family protein [Ramlibacter sp.]HWI80660.1 peptidoglycan DD-metalloendopeptidase family protein [Ramlibacter sp.]